MSWTREISYRLTGTITTGLTLDNSNPGAGSIPSGFMTYGDDNYGDSYYQPTAIYQGVYSNLPGAYKEFVFDYSCSTGDIFYQYQTSETGITYTAWSTAIDVSVDNDLTTRAPYHRFRFIFYSPLWSDEDELLVESVTEKFIIFAAGETISALEMNSNFGYVAQSDLLPRGSNSLLPTNSAYDLGSDIRCWNTLYCDSIDYDTNFSGVWSLVASVTLSAVASRIEMTGLNGDSEKEYMLLCSFHNANAGVALNVGYVINGDSGASYGLQRMNGAAAVAGAVRVNPRNYIGLALTEDTTTGFCHATGWLYSKSGKLRNGLVQWGYYSASTVKATYRDAVTWNNDSDTITSIAIYEINGNDMDINTKVMLFAR